MKYIICFVLLLFFLRASGITQSIPTIHAYFNTHNTTEFISKEQIDAAGDKNLSELLEDQLGIQISNASGNPNAPLISLRGFGNNAGSNSLILLNGSPLTNPDMGLTFLNAIPLATIKKIEVTPESNSVLYGNSAVGGVINIITEQPSARLSGEITSGIGNEGYQTLSGKIGQLFTTGWHYFIEMEKNIDDHNRPRDTTRQFNTSGTVGYQTKNNYLSVRAHTAKIKQKLPGPIVLGTAIATAQPNQYANSATAFFLLQENHQFSNHWRLESHLTNNTTNTTGNLISAFTQKRETTTFHPKIKGYFTPVNFTLGTDFTQDDYRYTMPTLSTFNIKDSAVEISPYTVSGFDLSSHWKTTFGIRNAWQNNTLNSISHTRRAFVTEQSLAFHPNAHWQYQIRRAENFRFPKADEINNDGLLLKTQTGVSYEFKISFKTKKNLTSVSIYQLDLKNEIAYAGGDPNDPIGTNRNLDATRRQGILIAEKWAITRKTFLYNHLSFVNAYYQSGPFAHHRIPLVANITDSIGIKQKFLQHWSAFISATYISGQYPAEDDNNTNYLGGYTLYNTNIQYQINHWKFSFKIKNIFDKRYNSYVLLPTGTQTAYAYPAEDRRFLLTVSYAL